MSIKMNLNESIIIDLLTKFSWIPVSERLPDRPEYDWVLVKTVFVPEGYPGVPHIAERRNGVWYSDCCEGPMEETLSVKVIAWFDMSLLRTQKLYVHEFTKLKGE